MEKSEIEHYLRDIWVREFEKEEKLVVDEFNKDDINTIVTYSENSTDYIYVRYKVYS